MADSNRPSSSGYSKPAPPPWKGKKRSHTTTTKPPPKQTGSNRAVRNPPQWPPKKPMKASFKKKANPPVWPPKKPTAAPSQSTTSSANEDSSGNDILRTPTKPKGPPRPPGPKKLKITPLILSKFNPLEDDDSSGPVPKVPKILKRASLQHTALSQIMAKSKSKSYTVKSKSPPLVPTTPQTVPTDRSISSDSAPKQKVSRWRNHPHAKLYMSNDDDTKSNSNKGRPGRPPPAPGKQARRDATTHSQANPQRQYKNIAGFSEHTLHEIDKCNMETLLGCMHEGSECLKYFHDALTTFGKQQQTQCANFLKLFKKSKNRYAKLDTMPNFFYAISLIHSLLEETVKQSAEFAKFIQISCLPMISELERQCDEKYKEIYHLSKVQDKKLSDLKHDVEKQRKMHKSSAEKVIIVRQRHEMQKQNEKYKPKDVNKKHNILTNMSERIAKTYSESDKINEAYIIAKEQEKKFKISTSEYNKFRMDYINKRNNGKHEIVNMEHFRVDSMLSVFQKLVKQQQKPQEKEVNKISVLQDDIVTHCEKMKAREVISKFIHFSIETYGEWKTPPAFENTLEIEYRDMFHCIDDAMAITLEINGDAKIPLVVPLLCERIKDLNGFKTEGIFRKSPIKTDMLRIKKRLQVKNFQLDEENVHVYASVLKQWLRGLDDLLIPKRYYHYCVSMANENKLNVKQFEVFFSQLPSVNRECLKYLIKFLRQLLAPQYQQHTKMNLENIAIVFGPTLLMPPNQLEPLVALQNAKSEKQFVISLIENS